MMSPPPSASTPSATDYSVGEEIASSAIHGIGIVFSVVALVILTAVAARQGPSLNIASVLVYGITLVLLYTASTLYHGVPDPRAKPWLRLFDHAAIFLLIAGTYTPFTLISLRGAWGWSLFALVWTLALCGIAMELTRVRRRAVLVGLYIGIGWVGLLAIKPLTEHIAPAGLWLLFGGGVAYTLGVPFYLWKRLPFNHALWHVFVLAGSVLQFFAVLYYVLPSR